jgi:hypothetical protein
MVGSMYVSMYGCMDVWMYVTTTRDIHVIFQPCVDVFDVSVIGIRQHVTSCFLRANIPCMHPPSSHIRSALESLSRPAQPPRDEAEDFPGAELKKSTP